MFAQTLQKEIRGLKSGSLPLHKATSQGGHVNDSNISVTVLAAKDLGNTISIKAGVFFSEVVAGCNCGEEPMEHSAYCEMQITIDKNTADALFEIVRD